MSKVKISVRDRYTKKDGTTLLCYVVYLKTEPVYRFFIRSYINACQLYCREIFFEPEIIVPGLQNFRIRKIDKPQGTGIAKGDPGITMF